MLGHLPHDFFRECLGLGGGADQDMRLDFLDHGKQIVVIFSVPFVVITSKWFLAKGKFVAL